MSRYSFAVYLHLCAFPNSKENKSGETQVPSGVSGAARARATMGGDVLRIGPAGAGSCLRASFARGPPRPPPPRRRRAAPESPCQSRCPTSSAFYAVSLVIVGMCVCVNVCAFSKKSFTCVQFSAHICA